MARNQNDKPGTVRIDPSYTLSPMFSSVVRKQHYCLHRSELHLGYWSLEVTEVEIEDQILKVKITCKDCGSYWETELQA